LAMRTFVDPGDIVIAEGPTYPGAVPTLTTYQARVIHIPLDAHGMSIDLLEEQLDVLGAVSAVTSGAAIAGDASRVRPAPQRIEAHTQEGGGVGHAQPPVSR